MKVIKRNGTSEDVKFDKVTSRISKLSYGLTVSPDIVAQKVLSSIHDGIRTTELDNITAEVSISMMTDHIDYEQLASRVIVSNLQKNCPDKFSDAMKRIGIQVDQSLDEYIQSERDYLFDFFGLKTLMKTYLSKDSNDNIVETPQYMLMRVSIAVSDNDINSIVETYNALSNKLYTHASPTLFNALMKTPQMSSCYLVAMKDDSLGAIYDTKKECALISKYGGGIGLHIHNIRAKDSRIYSTNGKSDGIIPMLRTINADARYCNQSGRRKGSYAIYLEPWHADIKDFLELRLNQGAEDSRCRDLFTALWIPDLFMKRLAENKDWSLFCPNEAPGLCDVYGEEFEKLYESYENQGRAREVVPIQTLWKMILKSQVETGTPYMLYKDSCNQKSNQKHLGTIKSSNLCVAPETWVKTKYGQKVICLLENKDIEIWNGYEWSFVTVRKTSESSTFLEVQVNVNNSVKILYCTPEHIFILEDGTRKPALELKSNDVLMPWTDEDGTLQTQKVIFVRESGRQSSSYCFTEHLRHSGVFNGILTGQCVEIIQHSDSENTAVCNLASIALPSFVNVQDNTFNFEKLKETTKLATKNLNNVIDRNFYPVEEAHKSNMKMRPIAIGVQGLADVFCMLKIPFDSDEAKQLNKKIFECLYFSALEESAELAEKYGSYEGFNDSPSAQGILQPELWGLKSPDDIIEKAKKGLRNSLMIGLMPTASTSQILGFNECFEPFTTNIYLRRTLAGEFVVVNKYLVNDLMNLGLWSKKLKDDIIRFNGSIQDIPHIPDNIKKLYKTVWEISPRTIIDMARDRSPYIDQSQSMNLFVEDPTNAKLSSIHMYSWKQGLKTGMYYLRTRPKASAIKFTLEPEQCTMCSA